MFENYASLSDEEKQQIKAIHRALRARAGSREGNLAWGFVRGFPYRRIERTVHTQTLADGSRYEHKPDARYLTYVIASCVPGFASITPDRPWRTDVHPAVRAWLDDPSGAIPAPPPRPKKPREERAAE